MKRHFDPVKHPRKKKGSSDGGQFAPKGGSDDAPSVFDKTKNGSTLPLSEKVLDKDFQLSLIENTSWDLVDDDTFELSASFGNAIVSKSGKSGGWSVSVSMDDVGEYSKDFDIENLQDALNWAHAELITSNPYKTRKYERG